jgi:cobyric acid synthase 1
MPEQKEIFSFNEFKEKEYDKLAELLRKNLDMAEIYKILEKK